MIRFTAQGHPNVLATHKTTLEITKEESLTPKGDCIVGVSADFDAGAVRDFARAHANAKMALCCEDVCDEITFTLNPEFSDEQEIVVRMGEHASARTLGTRASKAAKHLSRELVDRLKMGKEIEVTLEAIE